MVTEEFAIEIIKKHEFSKNEVKLNKYPQSGQKTVFKINIDINEKDFLLKIYEVISKKTLDDYTKGNISQDIFDAHVKSKIDRIEREINASKKCSLFPKILLHGEIFHLQVDGKYFIYYFEEKKEGINLNDSIMYKDPSLSEVSDFLLKMLNIITELDKIQMVHRDIKPQNIIFNNYNYFLIDPGLAKSFDDDTLTRDGGALGTLRYWAPEQEKIKASYNWNFQTDLYPLGLIAIEMLIPETRVLSYNFLQDLSYVKNLFESEYGETINKDFFRDIIVKLSSKQKFRRSNNLEDLKATLQNYIGG